MAMVQIEHLTFAYPTSGENIFEDVSLRFDTDWRLGLVGRNGRGKTTLLRLLCGAYEYRGKITSPAAFSYFPYPVADMERLTNEVLEEVCPQAAQWELVRELSLLELHEEILWRPFAALSGGERTKALLAALFLNEGRFLLIDEPTNHLDARGRALTAAYLRKKRGFLLVSHDRRFLDDCVDHIMALHRTEIEVRGGSFSAYMEDFARTQAAQEQQNERLRRDIGRLQQAAGRTARWSEQVEASKIGAAYDKGYIGHKSAKMMKRAKSLEARQQRAIEEKKGLLQNAESAEALKLLPLTYRAEQLAALRGVCLAYGAASPRIVCGPLDLTVRRGERIALDGRNGCGKSSLLKLLAGENTSGAQGAGSAEDSWRVVGRAKDGDGCANLRSAPETPDGCANLRSTAEMPDGCVNLRSAAEVPDGGTLLYRGEFRLGTGLVISYVPQDTSFLRGSLTDFARERGLDEALFKAVLRKLDFGRGQFDKDMADFSGGQKKKVLIAASLCTRAHLYLWDEPLNFIDVYSRMQIEELLLRFSPTMVFVEHDAAFREAVATRVVRL